MKLLLLSNSTNHGSGFLEHAQEMLGRFFGTRVREVLFVPYASVRFPYDAFADRVADRFRALGIGVRAIHRESDPARAMEAAEAIVVGGGNTFRLLARLQESSLVEPIRNRVLGGVPFVGWSAGANVACPTIKTTNDMPIVEPASFDALALVPFQINPHYTEARLPNHGGETRPERLLEFVQANPAVPVVALPEGTALLVEDGVVTLLGPTAATVFAADKEPRTLDPGPVTV